MFLFTQAKLELKDYRTLVEFTADLRTMNQNVFSYYRKESEEFKKALDLKVIVERRRKTNAVKLKW